MVEVKTRLSKRPFKELMHDAIDMMEVPGCSAEMQLISIARWKKKLVVLIAYEQVEGFITYLYRIGKTIYCVKRRDTM